MNTPTDDIIIDSAKVKNVWEKIKSNHGVNYFVDEFYRLLFRESPEVKSLFPNDLAQQKSKLLSMLDNVINGIEYINQLEEELHKLGQIHKDLGINKEMYDAFLIAIVEAANTSSGKQLTEAEQQAWKNAFLTVSNIMLQAY